MSINLLFRTPIPKPQHHQQPRQSQGKTIAENKHDVFHIQGIRQNEGHPDHQNSQISSAQPCNTFCPVGLDQLGNGAGTHNDGTGCPHELK